MNITSAKYMEMYGDNTAILATIDGVDWSIPLAEDNRHYQAIMEWVAEGNTIAEPD